MISICIIIIGILIAIKVLLSDGDSEFVRICRNVVIAGLVFYGLLFFLPGVLGIIAWIGCVVLAIGVMWALGMTIFRIF